MSNQPSEAALEAAGEFVYVEWDSGAPPDDPEAYDILNFYVGEMGILFEGNDEARDAHQKMTTDLAQRFDAFAAQAVAAERARIVERLEEQQSEALRLAGIASSLNNLRLELIQSSARAALGVAIKIAKGE